MEVAAVAAEQEGEEAVVHEVAAVGRHRRAVGMDAEDDLRSGDLLGRAGEADEAGMEVGDVAGEQRGSVARGIDGDEERLHLRRRGAQGVQRRGQLGKLGRADVRSEEHTSELQSLMRISYAVFCLKKQRK